MSEPQKPPKVRIIIKPTVAIVEEMFQQKHVSGSGKDAIFKPESIGWSMCCVEPSITLVMLEKPPFVAGQKLKWSIELDDVVPAPEVANG